MGGGKNLTVCHKAEEISLPELFKKRHKKSPELRKPIEGCASIQNKKTLEEQPCQCAAGSEANGCKDALLDSDHVLQCAQLRRRVLPNLKLERLFTEKGPCTIDLAAPFNKE